MTIPDYDHSPVTIPDYDHLPVIPNLLVGLFDWARKHPPSRPLLAVSARLSTVHGMLLETMTRVCMATKTRKEVLEEQTTHGTENVYRRDVNPTRDCRSWRRAPTI